MNKKLLFFLITGLSIFFIYSEISAEEKMQLAPITEVSSKDKIEINPQAENPVLINKEPMKVEGQQADRSPIISVDVQSSGGNINKSPLENSSQTVTKKPLQIGINKEAQEVVIQQGETTTKTKEPISIEGNDLKIQTPEGKMTINVLPDVITKTVIQKEPQKLNDISLKVVDKQPIYETTGLKEEKILNLIPIRMPIKTKVSAQTGEVLGVEKPWWAKILDPISS